jgi:inositol-hexakisphosphate/diphosphoinositol-pentakisphosphate 1-kinase
MKSLLICSFDKKLKAKPMREIIKRLEQKVKVLQIGTMEITNTPVEKWPPSDYFLCVGQKPSFPLDKAKEYVKISNSIPLLDLDSQQMLRSRIEIHRILQENSIPTPKTLSVLREKNITTSFSQTTDYIVVEGEKFMKPFVEKPRDSADHNIFIYLDGKESNYNCIRLFRKRENKCSETIENGFLFYFNLKWTLLGLKVLFFTRNIWILFQI